MPRRDPPHRRTINPFDDAKEGLTPARRAHIEERRQQQKRNKRRSDVPGTALLTREPALTPAFAAEFVKLLHAGLSPLTALSYFSPQHFDTLERAGRLQWLSHWERSPLMATASTSYMKGQWQDLDKDSRLEIALDKHMAELAYYLYTTDYARAEGLEYKKVSDAREAILQWISQGDEDTDSPYVKALKDLLEGKLEGMTSGPPRVGTSIAIEQIPVKQDS